MNQELPTINGELLRLRRETRGWALSDLATRACMSIKQIRQLEEGGSSAFYSETVKWTSAKKVGNLLGMQPDEVFVQVTPEVESPPQADVVDTSSDASPHAIAPEVDATAASASQDALVAVAADASVEATASLETTRTSKTPVFALAALFVVALAVAAWMRPEPEVVTEPAPALQNITAEASDVTPASAGAVDATVAAASQPPKAVPTTALSASSALNPVVVAPPVTPSLAASAVTPSSAPRVVTPAASAPSVPASKPANAAQVPAPAASAASKSI
jgi:cytoskeleton protein RodZ